jgi:hypothetical protein
VKKQPQKSTLFLKIGILIQLGKNDYKPDQTDTGHKHTGYNKQTWSYSGYAKKSQKNLSYSSRTRMKKKSTMGVLCGIVTKEF